MSISFSGSEIIEIAIGIERSGIAFYETLAKSTEDTMIRDSYRYLADKEREHLQAFQSMLDEVGKYQVPGSYAEDYGLYLNALVDSSVFTDDKIASEMAYKVASDIEAIELAISAEKDSILFYYEMRDIVPERRQKIVDSIIAEEKSHLRGLSELKKKLATS